MVELVVVVLLLGILAVSALARLPGRESIDGVRLLRELVDVGRLAQNVALADADSLVQLRVAAVGGGYVAEVLRDGAAWHVSRIDVTRASLGVAAGGAVGAVAPGTDLLLSYDALGDVTALLLGAVAGDATVGVALTITGDVPRAACIYPTGYADANACS